MQNEAELKHDNPFICLIRQIYNESAADAVCTDGYQNDMMLQIVEAQGSAQKSLVFFFQKEYEKLGSTLLERSCQATKTCS